MSTDINITIFQVKIIVALACDKILDWRDPQKLFLKISNLFMGWPSAHFHPITGNIIYTFGFSTLRKE